MPAPTSGLKRHFLDNGFLRLEYMLEAGPRITGAYLPAAKGNQFAEVPQVVWDTPYGEYRIFGGHRLWHTPENFPRTYIPDNEGVTVEEGTEFSRLIGPTEKSTGIQKIIEIEMVPGRAAARIRHKLVNHGLWDVVLAPWALTWLPTGGLCILPQQVEPLDASGLLPNRGLVLWPYTRWNDPRL